MEQSKKLSLDMGNVDRVERDIAPPMRMAITIPIVGTMMAIYVAVSPFSQRVVGEASKLVEVAKRLRLVEEQSAQKE